VVADFNNDGKLDLAGTGAAGISVALGNGDGTFQPALSVAAGSFIALAPADFNRDGSVDLAAVDTGHSPRRTAVLLNKGNATFRAPREYPGSDRSNSLAIGDFNGDGNLDIVSDTGGVLLGQGDGTFHPGTPFDAPAGARAIVTADLNLDGNLDLAIVADNPGVVGKPGLTYVYLGTGLGTFPAPNDYPADNPNSVAVGDFNGDGALDLVVTAGPPGVAVLLGNGDGTFQAPVTYSVGYHSVAVAVGDFNGDGHLDLAVATCNSCGTTYTTGEIAILLGNGDGTFQPAQNYPAGIAPSDVAIADLNGDGILDLAVANSAYNQGWYTILLGKGDGTFQPAVSYQLTGAAYSVAVGDFNLNGIPDLVIGASPYMSILLGVGDGTFQPPINYPGMGTVAIGDMNGDGKPDLVSSGVGTDAVSVMLGNGNGTFQPAIVNPAGPGVGGCCVANGVTVADFNGDGKLDVAVLGLYNAIAVLLGNGDGTLQPSVEYVVGTGRNFLLAVGDFNGDGKPDVAAGSGAAIGILLNITQ